MFAETVALETLGPGAMSAAQIATALMVGAFAWSLPIVVRRSAPRQPFAAMFLLAPVQAKAERSRRARAVLVRTLRAIAASTLTLALWPSPVPASMPQPTDAAPVIVIDGSASMGWEGDGQTPFDEAIGVAEQIVARAPKTRVVLADESPRWIPTSKLAELRPGAGTEELDAAFALATNVPRVVLLTDTRIGSTVAIPDHVEILRVGAPGPRANAAVVGFHVDGPDLVASVLWTGDVARPITLELSSPDGSMLQRSEVVEAGGTTSIRFERVVAAQGGVFRVGLLDAGDGLPSDDRAAAVVPRLTASLTPLREGVSPRDVERRVRTEAAVRALGARVAHEGAVLVGGPWDSGQSVDLRLGNDSVIGTTLAMADDDWEEATFVVRLAEALRSIRPVRATVSGRAARVEVPSAATGDLSVSDGAVLHAVLAESNEVLVGPSRGQVVAEVLVDGDVAAHAAWISDATESSLGERADLASVRFDDVDLETNESSPEVHGLVGTSGPVLWVLIAALALCLEPFARRGAS